MADIKKLLESMNSIGGLHIGDPVVITGDVQHKGETGDVVGFNQDNSFVIVDLYNHGRKSFHSSDVSYNDYVDPDHDEDMYVPEDKFAGEKVGQKPGDQVRGTEKATKKKSGAHPFKGRLVGAAEGKGSLLADLEEELKKPAPARDLAEEFEQFKEAVHKGTYGTTYQPDELRDEYGHRLPHQQIPGTSKTTINLGANNGKRGRPLKTAAPEIEMQPDPFGRTTGEIPKGKRGAVHRIARHGEDGPESGQMSPTTKSKQQPNTYNVVISTGPTAANEQTIKIVAHSESEALKRARRYAIKNNLRFPEISIQQLSEEHNPTDTLTLDVPLMIRMLEYAREDAKTDMDLHDVVERMINLSAEGRTLTMQDYDAICAQQKQVGEAKGLKKRVRIVQGSYKGRTGTIGEVRHGLFKGAPKKYTIDLDGGGNVMLPGEALRLIKDPVTESDLFNPTNPMGFTNPYSPLNPVGVFKSVGPVTADDVKTLVQILTGTVGAAAAGIFAKHFVNTIRKTASAINQTTEANSRELLELQKHIAAMYRTLNKTKNEKTKEKYTKMLKDAHDALEEITTRMQMKASGTVGEQVDEGGMVPMQPRGEKPFKPPMTAPKKKYPAIGTIAWEQLPKHVQQMLLKKRGHVKEQTAAVATAGGPAGSNNTSNIKPTGTTPPAAGGATATPDQLAQLNQQKANLQKNVAQLKSAGVNIDPARAAQTLQKTDTGAPMNAQDKDTLSKLAPALGNVLNRPDLSTQLNTLIKKAGGGAQ